MGDVDVMSVGKTNYYAVHKGTFSYRIAEGKKFEDREHCWQVKSDNGRAFYVNLAGERKWKLPDINLTDGERKLQELKRMEAKAQRASRPAGTFSQKPSAAAAMKPDDRAKLEFGARDRAALLLKPGAAFGHATDRKPVLRVAKMAAMPYYSQGLLDKHLFAQIVATCTREFFYDHAKFQEPEQKILEKKVQDMALARIGEALKKGDYQKVIEDLEQRVRDAVTEKKDAEDRMARSIDQMDSMKEEIFKLKTDKRDVVLHSFRRLTSGGLIKTYWERWLAYRIELEETAIRKKAQDGVDSMHARVVALEKELNDHKVTSAKNKADAQSANSLVKRLTMVNECLRVIKLQSFLTYLVRLKDSDWERKCWALQKMVDHCPSCELRPVEHERTAARLTASLNMFEDAQQLLKDKDAIVQEQRHRANRLDDDLSRALQALRDKTTECSLQEQKNESQKDIFDAMRAQVDAMTEKENVRNSEMRFLEDELANSHTQLDNANRTLRNMVPREEGLAPFFTNEASMAANRALDLGEDTRLRRNNDPTLHEPFARRRTGVLAQDPTAKLGNKFGPYIDSPYRPSALMPDPRPPANFDEYASPPPSPSAGDRGHAATPPTAVCQKCGLRLHLAPFCSKDGQRHQTAKAYSIGPDTVRDNFVAQQTHVPPLVRPNMSTVSMPAMQVERYSQYPKGPLEVQEMAAYMRDTRVSAMRRPPDWHTRPMQSQPGQQMGPSWSSVFQTDDLNAGAYGMPTRVADPLFGIYSKDQALGTIDDDKKKAPQFTSLQQQMQTPSFRQRI